MEKQLATRAATKQIRLQHWRKIIQDRAESGLTVKEYCEQHNITKDSYYYWLRTVREATLHSMGPVFAELEAPEKDLQNGDFHPELEIEINRARIRINRDTPEQFLLQAIHVLKYMSPILRVKECRGGCFLSLSACQSKEKKHLAVITIP